MPEEETMIGYFRLPLTLIAHSDRVGIQLMRVAIAIVFLWIGELKPAERAWQAANNTYGFSKGLGTLELMIGVLTLVGLASRRLGFVGATLAFLTPFVTLSFLITMPEAWVASLGDTQHGFPYLSGGGRLVLKDVMLLAGALLVMADSARALLEERPSAESSRRSSPAALLSGRPARVAG
jgi:uncharacterized membrane protein YkgB